jgi:hypothetical protein
VFTYKNQGRYKVVKRFSFHNIKHLFKPLSYTISYAIHIHCIWVQHAYQSCQLPLLNLPILSELQIII